MLIATVCYLSSVKSDRIIEDLTGFGVFRPIIDDYIYIYICFIVTVVLQVSHAGKQITYIIDTKI